MKLNIFLILIIFLQISCKKEQKISTETKEITTQTIDLSKGKHCFESVLKNDINDDEKVSKKDILNVTVNINEGNVTGTYNFLPHNNDSSVGNFTGTVKDNIITSIYSYSKNNIELKEEVVFKIENKHISLLGGEKVKKEGIFYFKNKSNGIYMIQIPRILCK
ncbi:MAG: hypothetical protein V3U80_03465 [Flavobacteriaceae bacterium]